MLMPSDMLRARLDAKQDQAQVENKPFAEAVFREAESMVSGTFYGRPFGEAAAVLTTEYQALAARADNEEARLAWYAAVTCLEQVMDELGSYG